MKGDYISVTYKTGGGQTIQRQIIAEKDGSSVVVTMPGRSDPLPFITVETLNKSQKTTRTARFAAGEVVEVTEGHNTIERPKRTSK